MKNSSASVEPILHFNRSISGERRKFLRQDVSFVRQGGNLILPSDQRTQRRTMDIGKILSVILAVLYVAWYLITTTDFELGLLLIFIYLLFSLTLIWFPEPLASFTGFLSNGRFIDSESPPILVSFMGWVFLIGGPVFQYCCLTE